MGVKLGNSGGRRRRAHGVMAEINVTPFVDVMLVLLVIFMVTAPLLTAGVQIDLPKADAQAIGQQDNAPLEITLDRQGGLFVGETKMTVERLTVMLQSIAAETTERRVYIRADQALDYGKVMEVMGLVSRLGFTKIALVTDPTSGKK
ncbi:MAG TPA: protein TolR [Alphaproteobacteria bacterium]|nr:protein TolR [Rhodospirillaceae bacterium]HRJ66688.1 protein TolR [Alphaproteobacteria bacterium]